MKKLYNLRFYTPDGSRDPDLKEAVLKEVHSLEDLAGAQFFLTEEMLAALRLMLERREAFERVEVWEEEFCVRKLEKLGYKVTYPTTELPW